MPSSPVLAQWELAVRLRERRRQLDMKAREISASLKFSPNYWSAVENGRTIIAEDKLRQLTGILRLSEDEAGELQTLRAKALGHGWWMDYAGFLSDEDLLRYYGLEHGAATIRSYEAGIMTGLLQTPEYARALIEADPEVSPTSVRQLVELRRRRQARLFSENPPGLTVVQSEATLRQEIGGKKTLRKQLTHLAQLIKELDGVLDFRIVPFATTPLGMIGASTLHILTFESGNLPTVVWRESVTSVGIAEQHELVEILEVSYEQALRSCLGQEESLSLVEEIACDLA